jgi:CBS domain-containing protein
MSVEAANPIFEHFHSVTVADVIGDKKFDVVTIKSSDTVEKAVRILSEKKFLSAPVLSEKDEFLGFVDVLDILKHVIRTAPDIYSLKQDELQSLKIAGRAMALAPLSEVVNFSEKDPFMVIQASVPASNLIKIFARGFHRAVVYDKEKIIGLVSQSDAVRYLSKHLHTGKLKDIGNQTLKELGYASSDIETIGEKKSVLEALHKINSKAVGQLAVVNEENGRLTGNFSASDLRGLYQENFPHLLDTVRHFLNKNSPNSLQPIVGLGSSTLVQIVKELVESKLHHLWVVDDFKPTGIITLTDVMRICNSKH